MNPESEEFLRVVQVVLERERFSYEKQIDLAEAVRTGRLEVILESATRQIPQMMIRLNAEVWGQKVQDETVTFEAKFSRSWPATWWQAFKSEYFPAWALKRWPVRLQISSETQKQTHTFKTVALLPNFRYDAPPQADGRHVLASYVTAEPLRRFPSGGS